jgi:hypothetical protein
MLVYILEHFFTGDVTIKKDIFIAIMVLFEKLDTI